MRSLVCSKPGVFQYQEITAPLLRKGHAIIRIKRIGICGTDLHAYRGTQPYFEYPRILGHELSGDVIDMDGAIGFTPGEAVTLIPYLSCMKCIACRNGRTNCCSAINVIGVHSDGGMVDYLSIPQELLVKSNGLTYDQLTLIEPLAIGAHGIARAAIQPGEFVLVSGAGPIGLGTMEFARLAGAVVIALDIDERRLEFCQSKMKVNHVINPRKSNVAERLLEITNGDMPTVVIDATGNQQAINAGFQYMAHGGRYILIGLQRDEIKVSHPEFHKRESTLMSSRNATRKDFEFVIDNIKNELIDPLNYITHRVQFGEVKEKFESWLDPANGVIKAIVENE